MATKLAEICAAQGKRDAFDKLANDITAMDSSGEYRAKLADIASALPGHPLAGGGSSAAAPVSAPVVVHPRGPPVVAAARRCCHSSGGQHGCARYPDSSGLACRGMTVVKPLRAGASSGLRARWHDHRQAVQFARKTAPAPRFVAAPAAGELPAVAQPVALGSGKSRWKRILPSSIIVEEGNVVRSAPESAMDFTGLLDCDADQPRVGRPVDASRKCSTSALMLAARVF